MEAELTKSTTALALVLSAGLALAGCNETEPKEEDNDAWTVADSGGGSDATSKEDTGHSGADASADTSNGGMDALADSSAPDPDGANPDSGSGPDAASVDTGGSVDAGACQGAGHGTPQEIASTPRKNANLELLSLTLTNKVVAPTRIYKRVTRDVAKIKKKNSRLSSIKHRSPHDGKTLLLDVSGQTQQAIQNGTYTDWDCLNQHYVKKSHSTPSYGSYVKLELKGLYDVGIVGKDYEALRGIKNAGPNRRIGDGPTICAERKGDVYHYVFVDAWGDCPSGCINHKYWYYTVDGSGTVTKKGESSNNGNPSWAKICRP